MRVRRTGALAVATTPLLLAMLTACGNNEEEGDARAAAACPADLDSQVADQQLPADMPPVPGQRLYRYESQGKTRIWFATLTGDPGDLEPVRDRIVNGLRDVNYTIKDTDAEKGAEAEAEFTGPHDGSVRVRPLCKDRLEIRYRLES